LLIFWHFSHAERKKKNFSSKIKESRKIHDFFLNPALFCCYSIFDANPMGRRKLSILRLKMIIDDRFLSSRYDLLGVIIS